MKLILFYTDPGSGVMLLQVLLAFGASAVFYFRKYFYRFFGREKYPAETSSIEGGTKTPGQRQ